MLQGGCQPRGVCTLQQKIPSKNEKARDAGADNGKDQDLRYVFSTVRLSLPAATAGKEYSGIFVVRVGKDLHKALAVEALRHGESLNSYCMHLLREERALYGKNKRMQRISGRARKPTSSKKC